MGNGIVNELKKEFQIEDEWVGFEIHPETPPEGVPLASLFPESAIKGMFNNLTRMGSRYGIEIKPHSGLSNSRLALKASEFAKDQGKFHAFHEAVFRAYFSEGKDIGNLEIILEITQGSGMNQEELKKALDENRYSARLYEIQQQARRLDITGAPTFIINDRYKIVGAQPVETFREALAKIASKKSL